MWIVHCPRHNADLAPIAVLYMAVSKVLLDLGRTRRGRSFLDR